MRKCVAFAVLALLAWPLPAPAYIDGGGWQVTLPEILSEFRTVTLVEVDKVNLARGAFRFKLGKPLKGLPDLKEVKLQIDWGEPGSPFKEMAAGRVAVHFTQSSEKKLISPASSATLENILANRACLTFLDGSWLHTTWGTDGWQNGSVRRDFELVFIGSSAELVDAVTKLLRGHEVLARCRRLRNTADIQWVRYSLASPNSKTLARDPSAPAASGRPVAAWSAELRDKSGAVRAQAALALAELGAAAREAEDALTAALRDPAPDVRCAAVAALGAIVPDGKGAIEGLARALTDEDWFVRLSAAQALQKFGPKAAAAVPALIQATKPNDAVKDFRPVRCGAAMIALARIDPASKELEAAVRMVVGKLLEDERQGSFGARATGARMLGEIGAAALPSVPTLVKLLQYPDGDVRVASAEALLRIAPDPHGAAALGVLSDALRHADLLVRRRAAEALGGLGPTSSTVLPALRAAAQDPEPEVRQAAQDAVRRIGQ